jgi:hypothetical protein
VAIVLRGLVVAAADVAPSEWPDRSQLRWLALKALPVVADARGSFGGAAEGHRFHGDG